MSEKKNIFIGSIISYVTVITEIILSIFFTPFLLSQLGDIDYGIRAFCNSLVSYLSLLTLGIGNAYFRFRKLSDNKNPQKAKNINGLFILSHLIISFIAIVTGLIFLILLNTKAIQFSKFPIERYNAINTVLFILIIRTALHYPFGVITIIITYRRRFIFKNLLNLLNVLLFPLIVYIIIRLNIQGDLLIAISIISFVVSLSIDLIKVIFTFSKLKERVTFKLKKDDFALLKPIFSFCLVMFVSSAVSIVHNATDQVILGLTISATSITFYSLAVSFSSYLTTATSTISGLMGPKLTNDAIDNDMEKVQKTCNLTWNTMTIILCLIVGGFASCGKEFIFGWVGPEKKDVYFYALALFVVNLLSTGVTLSYTVHSALNRHKYAAFIYIISLIINIAMSFILCVFIGIWGVIIPTIICKLFEAIALTIYTTRVIKISMSTYWISLLVNMCFAAGAFVIVYFTFQIFNIERLGYYLQASIKGVIFLLLYSVCIIIFKRKFLIYFIKLLRRKD